MTKISSATHRDVPVLLSENLCFGCGLESLFFYITAMYIRGGRNNSTQSTNVCGVATKVIRYTVHNTKHKSFEPNSTMLSRFFTDVCLCIQTLSRISSEQLRFKVTLILHGNRAGFIEQRSELCLTLKMSHVEIFTEVCICCFRRYTLQRTCS